MPLLAVAAAGLAWVLVGLYTRAMTASRRLEAPNARSMHKVPVPVGGGLGIVATTLALWPLSPGADVASHALLLGCFAALSALSWIDDRLRLSPAVRLAAQAVAVGLCLASLPADARVLAVIPTIVERVAIGLAWLWFINLFNFMDGIDGLAGSETIAIAMGYVLLLAYAGQAGPLWHPALIVAAATLGYLFWNWHPARVFMGDAGSIPLGFLLGWLLLDLALRGYWAAAIILPAYFAADATYTLCRRGLRGEKLWEAHRQHFYQRAVLGGATPPGVVWRVSAANAALIALALVSISYPVTALVAAAVVVAGLLGHLQMLAAARAS
jgi:UDP-N-acetylmuramyl pentapeptide phosphotransferase/UDP-N-acetylglucosamine-1-phosphate transferase